MLCIFFFTSVIVAVGFSVFVWLSPFFFKALLLLEFLHISRCLFLSSSVISDTFFFLFFIFSRFFFLISSYFSAFSFLIALCIVFASRHYLMAFLKKKTILIIINNILSITNRYSEILRHPLIYCTLNNQIMNER